MKKEPIIHVKNVSKSYPIAGKEFMALKQIDLSLNEGEFAGIVGPSGSGKTTLLNIIGSLDKPTQGDAFVLNKDIKALSHNEAASLRNYHVGFIFQVFNLLPVYTVFENVEFALLLQNNSAKERREAVMRALNWVGLNDHADKRPDKLSGGESQRVAIARAMVKVPKIVLADEPTANLDSENADRLHDLFFELRDELGCSFVIVTHNKDLAKRADRTISLKDGRIEA